MTPDEPLSTGQAAQYLNVSINTVRRWAKTGLLPHTLLPSGRMRFHRTDLEASLRRVP